ncbi:hypothetical protein V1525DRAFT_92374 [Lipomyces kononenkoae]|uniref:Uncharacterized protein n=1 Tax=Lipomyces kononenkoae TaxID=34357 RepID=A0ACC3TBU4_LIPKO
MKMIRHRSIIITRKFLIQNLPWHIHSISIRSLSISGCVFSPRHGNYQGPTLAHFVQASAARQLWRKTLRAINELSDPELKKDMRKWAREEFKRHKNVTDLEQIKYFIAEGKKQLEMMAETFQRSRLS